MNFIEKHGMKFSIAASVVMIAIIMFLSKANAADLGGNCCADLEERIAELEATTPRKGNRKLAVMVSGQVNKAIVFYDGDQKIIDNTSDESRFTFSGISRIDRLSTVGFVLDIATASVLDPTANDLSVRRAALFVDTNMGRVVVGKFESAGFQITETVLGNTTPAVRPLNLVGVSPFDGDIENVIRVDTADLHGFKLSASWSSDSESKEIAARYFGTAGEFAVSGGIAYIDRGANEHFAGSVSAKHTKTGVFGAIAAAVDSGDYVWHATGGVDAKLNTLGATTFYAEYGDLTDAFGVKGWGAGIVQSVDAAAMDAYVSFRSIEDEDIFMIGSRVSF